VRKNERSELDEGERWAPEEPTGLEERETEGMTTSNDERVALPSALAEIAEDFSSVSARERLQLLLEFSDELPGLPERFTGHEELLEQVDECQSPIFLAVEVEPPGAGDDALVNLFFQAPAEAPTTRGFAGILHEGLDGLSAAEVLAVPDDAPYRFGLSEAVSPLRLRGMVAMLGRIKRQVRLKSDPGAAAAG
jgi:cysteine desulfuration protein SufE